MNILSAEIIENETCLCGSGALEVAIDLPRFPLTGIYIDSSEPDFNNFHDQALMVCMECGHIQLRNILPQKILYGRHNVHRSAQSHHSPQAIDYFVSYVKSLVPDRIFKCILEVGCNDLSLLNRLKVLGSESIGIDPIWIDRDLRNGKNISVIGKYIEQVDFALDIPTPPDLIVSTHNLEHIASPIPYYKKLMDRASDDALFIIEVPDVGIMFENLRIDQIFMQHNHYYELRSLLNFIESIDGHYIDHCYNYNNWGGTILIAFGKGLKKESGNKPKNPWDKNKIRDQYSLYRNRMQGIIKIVKEIKQDIWGYGAGQMVPTLAYHLRSDLAFLNGILDNNQDRAGLYYPHLKPQILDADGEYNFDQSMVIILAQDAVRPIIKRLENFNPGYVLVPGNVY